MITAEIKIHQEPAPYKYHQSYTSYTLMTGAQKEKYELDHQVALEDAKKIVTIGQTVKLESNPNKVQIVGFIEDPKEVIMYAGNMCVVYAKHLNSPGSSSLRYAIAEFDLSTLTDPVQQQLPNLLEGNQNDVPM